MTDVDKLRKTHKVVEAQPGPQEAFLRCRADVALYGGGAGGGKTYAQLIDPLRWVHDGAFRGVIFRRESVQIKTEGGLWDESQDLYRLAGGEPVSTPKPKWTFESGAVIAFHHLKHEKNKYDHQGGQYAFIGFDELTHFSETQFIYLLSRNRTQAKMSPYVRATTNPDASSWVYKWVRPFLQSDGKTPDPDVCGELRYFTIENQSVRWVEEDWHDIDETTGEVIRPKSFTFIPALVGDNEYLGADYVANLRAQSRADQQRLLHGLWVTDIGKAMFRHHDIQIVQQRAIPQGLQWVRYWDLADTEVPMRDQDPRNGDGPDWTAGARCAVWHPEPGNVHHDAEHGQPILIVDDVEYMQLEGSQKQRKMQDVAKRDGKRTIIGIETEPGATGKEAARHYRDQVLSAYRVEGDRPTGSKEDRAKPWRALAEKGRVWFVDGPWVSQVLWWVERFPHHKRDTIDAISGGFAMAERFAKRPARRVRRARRVGRYKNPFG